MAVVFTMSLMQTFTVNRSVIELNHLRHPGGGGISESWGADSDKIAFYTKYSVLMVVGSPFLSLGRKHDHHQQYLF
jgi:hypothetical protein